MGRCIAVDPSARPAAYGRRCVLDDEVIHSEHMDAFGETFEAPVSYSGWTPQTFPGYRDGSK